MILIYIANLIITVLVGTLIFVFNNLDSAIFILNIVFLLLTLEMPTIYMLFANRKKLDKNDNELLVPSVLVFSAFFLVDLVFYSICVAIHSTNIYLFVLYTVIVHCVMVAVLLVVKAFTNYIRNQHKGDKNI